MVKTKTPGVYRRGSRYVVVFRDQHGRQRKASARTYDEARKLKGARVADVARGEFDAGSRDLFREYAGAWVERYQGTGRRGFRESTRDDYRRLLREFAFPFFGRRRLAEITPADVAAFIAWLCDGEAMAELEHRHQVEAAEAAGKTRPVRRRARRDLSDSTVRNIVNPVRSCFATAVREGKVRHNPTSGAALPHRQRVEDDDHMEVRPLAREQLAVFLAVVHPRHRTMFRLLAATGVRISELVALEWRHVRLDGSDACVRIRRAIVRGRVQPPKSRHGRRDVPLNAAMVSELRRHRAASEWPGNEELVFPSQAGTPLNVENLRRRVLRPAAEEAGAPWAGFHTFRHTRAAMLFDRGDNVVQVQRWLGHHSPSFTLDTYVHLLPDRRPAAVELDAELNEGNKVATEPTSLDPTRPEAAAVDVAA